MALNTAAASGPAGPAAVTVANNDRLVTSLVATEFVGVWKNRPAHAEVCNRGWQSEWYGNMVHGDTLRIPVLPRYRVIEGYSGADADTFQAQKELAPYVDLHFRQPNKLETAKDMFDRGLYIQPKLEMEKARRKVETLVDFVETDIAKQEIEGYYRGIQSVVYPTGTTPAADASNSFCTSAGPESGNLAGVRAYTKARATLTALGVTRRELCALLSPEAQEAYSRSALNAPYEWPWGSEAARKGMVTGMGKVGWKFVESVHNGTYGYGDLNITGVVQTRGAHGENFSNLRVDGGIATGQVIPKNTYVQVAGSHSVNEVRGEAMGALESYRTTADATVASGFVDLPLDHNGRASTTGEGMRTRNCDALPADNAAVYINGLDTRIAGNRFAVRGATVEQSMLVSRDACALVVAQPELPTGDSIVARMVSADSYRVAAAHIKWFDGDSKQYRDSLIMRWAAGVLEKVAGIILRGQEAGGAGALV